ncbi:myotubularin-related protein 9 isoform X2 [Toxorhynchites rutilus septentrionalis]|uniref:myotubularin-related protein 9 isoform X2 n=1 Tax=Toxorhynchites rutilus septentrionalis TaxID=329112 RepID=UPI00247A8B7B|nr:myotubularin-related protein 9 isoform X2 [Toxorhynchites rutilus septentrionalis]
MEFAELIRTPKLDGVQLYEQLTREPIDGTLCITSHVLILSTRKEGAREAWLLHQNVDIVERKPCITNNVLEGGTIILKCKDLRIIHLRINTPQEYFNISNSIEQLSNLEEIKKLYPFFYIPMYNVIQDGHTEYTMETEFAKLLATEEWRLTTVNHDYKVCPTYGSRLMVLKSITDEQIIQSAAFRDGGRFPVLAYKHTNGAVLFRCAQPLAGPGVKRCRADEAILNAVVEPGGKKGCIFDTWGKHKNTNTEFEPHYSQWRVLSRPIGPLSSVSALLDSFVKLMDACNDVSSGSDRWLSRLENSGWLTYVLNAINVSCIVAQCLALEGVPVLVHGGKGLDTPAIVTSVAQIILNPDCRTIKGLQALIEREWLWAGYPFSTRHKHSCYTPSAQRHKTSSATFVLFLDCVFQLYNQFPCSFEFDSRYLISLFEHSYSSQYGTFLCDSERERVELKVRERTISLWSHINRPQVIDTLLNPMYIPNVAVIWPSVAPLSIILWSDLYTRWVIDHSQSEATRSRMQSIVTEEKELEKKARKLRRELVELQEEYHRMIAEDSLLTCEEEFGDNKRI